MTAHTGPRVSIGLPVHNGEAHIERAIESLLAQTMPEFELIVSDNASDDRTGDIVRRIVVRDKRVRYHRQPANIGAFANFRFVLDQATSDYFMWAAADDHWAPDFLAENLNFLIDHPDYVASVSRAVFDGAESDSGDAMGTFPLAGSVGENQQAFLLNPAANTRFYALHRARSIRRAWIDEPFWASDWAVVCRTLEHGRYHEVPRVLMGRGRHGVSSRGHRAVLSFRFSRINTALPFLRFTRYVLKIPSIRRNPRLWLQLAWINVDGALMMLRRRLGL
jgi:glycosyltransferase involved in cell wall biosynthesis